MSTTIQSPHRPHGHGSVPAAHFDTHAHDAHGGSGGHGVGHVVPPRILINTALVLLVLTGLTVAVMWFDLGEFNIYIALGIAVLKGSLVCLFFMHLRWDRPFNSIVFIGALALVALFIGFALTDTSEYQHEIIPGEAPKVQLKITELMPPPPETAPTAPASAAPAEPAKPH